MFIKIWFLPLLLAVSSSLASPSPTPQYPSPSPDPPRAGYYSSPSQKPVYTAQRARGESVSREQQNSREEDDEPYPSTSTLGTAQTSHGAVEDQPENTGFVEPIDFKNLLREVESSSKGLGDIGASSSSSNPLFASESKNSFAGFFGSNNKDPFADFGSSLATASSDRNSKRPDSSEDSPGFVDPNVQFRSLFDSSQTANSGFKPEDFLGYKGDASSSEPSKGSQTQAYPSFTYTGRKDDEYGPSSSSNPKYRSSYRQVESQDDDYNNNPNQYRHRDDREDSDQDDRGYYNSGEEQDDRRGGGPGGYSRGGGGGGGPPPPPRGYHSSPAPQETSHRPQSTGKRSSGPKASASSNNPKCKKIEKTVDYQNDDYASFTEPEPDYDPSTYRGRYKRQSSRQGRQSGGGGGRGNKRPMTCYVCEDEQGRYAERCSYDSKANPNKGEYFHSSSSAYSDNGRRPSGKSDRIRRNPSGSRQQAAEASSTNSESASSPPTTVSAKEKNPEIEESEPEKVIEKRQSSGDRYAGDFGGNGNRRQSSHNNGRNNNGDDFEFNSRNNGGGGGEYGLPRGYIGNNNGRVDDFGGEGRNSNNRGDRPSDNTHAGTGSSSSGSGRNDENNYGFTGNRDNNRDNFGFDAPSFNDFNFGGSDFGREASPSGGGGGGPSREFNFDFSIPKEYDPDIQLPQRERGGNANHERVNNPDGSESSDSHSFPANFETGYDDYVKQYFPEPFGGGEHAGGGGGSSTHRPSSSPSSYSPSSGPSISSSPGNHQPSYRPSYHHHHNGPSNSFNQHENSPPSRPNYHFNSNSNNNNNRGNPEKQHTQPSHNFAPPPNFFDDGGSGQGGFENTQSLHNLMNNFDGKERSGCQKIQKGDMSCYVCKDARGMNKEECMYASNDPKNQRMAYHEVTEYSSDPPASVLPLPRPHQLNHNANNNNGHPLGTHSGPLHQSGSSPVSSSVSHDEKKSSSSPSSTSSNPSTSSTTDESKSKPSSGSVTRVESKVISVKFHEENKSPPVEYDFDY